MTCNYFSDKKISINITYNKELNILYINLDNHKELFLEDISPHLRIAYTILEEDLKILSDSVLYKKFDKTLINYLMERCSHISYKIYNECGVNIDFNLNILNSLKD